MSGQQELLGTSCWDGWYCLSDFQLHSTGNLLVVETRTYIQGSQMNINMYVSSIINA